MPYKDKEKEREAKARYEAKRKAQNGERHRVWTMIFYPDSAPPEWEDYLSSINLPIWVSPVHDKDVWTKADEKADSRHKAGSSKKPHYHLICQYETQVDRATFLKDMAYLNGSDYVKHVRSLVSMVRYLVHMDDPQKAQYKQEDVRVFGSANIDLMAELGKEERHIMLRQMRRYIRQNNVVNFCDFVDYCDDCENSWARLLDDNSSYIIEKYIKSIRYKLQEEACRTVSDIVSVRVNMETGEVINETCQG